MIAVIAANTFREVLRDRVWFVLLGFGFVLLAGSKALSPIALGEGGRLTVDLGLSALALLGLLVVTVVGASLVHQEIDRRTVHVILARPVSRTVYLLGKWAGFTASLWVSGALMGLGLTAVAWWVRGPQAVLPTAQAVVLICLSFAVLTALAVLFSALSTPLLSSLYTLSLYALGWWTADIRSFAKALAEPVRSGLTAVSYALPNLELFSARLAVAHAEPVPVLQLALAAVYAAGYGAAVLGLAALAFRGREFK
jgi:ABC-type transport system involved in multi-copper enzyme maturation permease subunit